MPSISAEAAIGRDEAADWQLRPEDHARALPPEAGPLKRVLERSEIKEITARYRAADSAAVAAQARYKLIGRLALYSATTATLVGALFILPIQPWLTDLPGAIASAVQILALITAFLASRWLAAAKPFDAWMKRRAEAEIARIQLFDSVATADESVRVGELPLLLLKLEYFRRYQLDVQRRYYSGRGRQHEAAVWRNNGWLTVSLVITIVSVALGTLIALRVAAAWDLPIPAWLLTWSRALVPPEANRVVLALGVIASGVYGLGVARSLMDLDERNASRFLTTAQNLEFFAESLPQVREAAAAGKGDIVLAFIQRVQNQISSEHREWILLSRRYDGQY